MSIASEISRLQTAKSDLATSITNKGVTVPAATTIDGYAALVDQIQTGGSYPIPSNAVEMASLKGDGNAYIDTGIKGSSSITFKMEVYFTTSFTNANVAIIGSRISSTSSQLTVQYYNTSSNKYFRWAFGNNSVTTANHGGTTGDYIVGNLDREKLFVISGAKELTEEVASATFNNNYNMYLFAMNNGGTVGGLGGNAYTRIYWCKIYDSGVLVRDFVPARVGQVGYMFDKVSGQLFGNANSTGAFGLGSDVT